MKNELLNQMKEELNQKREEKNQQDIIIEKLILKYVPSIKKGETNQIYMYMGSYRFGSQGKWIFENRDSKSFEFSLYKDLEQQKPISISRDERETFEKNHLILVPEDYKEDFYYEEEYKEKQKEFFRNSILHTQEEAKNILKKSYVKKQF